MAVLKFRNLTTGQATPVPTGEFTVGREDSAYVHVDDASVSRQHARIINQEDGFYVEDLGSVNGTAAKGALIRGRVKVDLGEIIYIGSVPYRVDPEVGGEPEAEPSAGMRVVNRAYMRKNTQRIVLPRDTPPVVERPALEKIVGPEAKPPLVNEAANPESSAARVPEPPPPTRLPIVRPSTRPEPKGEPVRKSVSLPVAPDLEDSRFVPETKKPDSAPGSLALPAERAASRPAESVAVEESEEPSSTRVNWERLLLVFLAGVGVGLLVGLYFAKVFLEMGGKPGSLP